MTSPAASLPAHSALERLDLVVAQLCEARPLAPGQPTIVLERQRHELPRALASACTKRSSRLAIESSCTA